jgi:hypothetical protein
MALLFLEGFESGGESVDLATELSQRGWVTEAVGDRQSQVPQLGTGRVSGNSMVVDGDHIEPYSFQSSYRRAGLAAGTTYTVGFGVRTEGSARVYLRLLASGDATFSKFAQLLIAPDINSVQYEGKRLVSGAWSGISYPIVVVPTLVTERWHYVEITLSVEASGTGTVIVRINGTAVFSQSGVWTMPAGATMCGIRFATLSGYGGDFHLYPVTLDDIYVCNETSGGPTTFIGPSHLIAVQPAGDGASSDWVPSTPGDHYAMVDELPSDEDVTYVESDTLDETDLYTYTAVPGNPSIAGVQINARCRVSYGGTGKLVLPIVSDSVTEDGPITNIVSSEYATVSRISTLDPATGLPWTAAGLNASQIGIKVKE